jgi:IS1 family transposase
MNRLSIEDRAKVVNCLIEGCSLRSTVRLTGVAKKTVSRILVEVGEACAAFHDKIMRNLPCKVVQVDEVWSFTYCKEANIPEHLQGQDGIGDTWTWIAIDADSKLIPSWHVGLRDLNAACNFIHDLKSRLASRVQLTSDGFAPYLVAVEDAFGADIDYAMLVKLYGRETGKAETRYSPPVCIGARRRKKIGNPDRNLVSTSFVERQNLTLRMTNRRFTRLTNAFSKKLENHKHMMAIYAMNYNFARIHQTLRVTPAMEAGITNHVWSINEIVELLEPEQMKVSE